MQFDLQKELGNGAALGFDPDSGRLLRRYWITTHHDENLMVYRELTPEAFRSAAEQAGASECLAQIPSLAERYAHYQVTARVMPIETLEGRTLAGLGFGSELELYTLGQLFVLRDLAPETDEIFPELRLAGEAKAVHRIHLRTPTPIASIRAGEALVLCLQGGQTLKLDRRFETVIF